MKNHSVIQSVFRFAIIVYIITLASFSDVYAQPKPSGYFGFEPGSDRNLFTYEKLISYLQEVDSSSDRVEMREIGRSPEGRPMYICFISSEENIARLDYFKDLNKRLALDDAIPQAEMDRMLEEGKIFFLSTLSMHSTEVAPSQSAPLIAYDLATTEDAMKRKWLNDVVYMMVPCHNPDGMDIVVSHYNRFKGTRYEGSSEPRVYHKYVGHDNNRDFVTLSQEDTRAIARIYNTEWYPQVMIEKHQMGSTGTRYFVPPNHDPITENIDAGIWYWAGIFGTNMAKDMTREGLKGISQHYMFDDYWPGSTETCIWKNVIGMLTEAASAKRATPVYIEPNELSVSGKGLGEYKKSINMPEPWPGGWWRLSDIVQYEISSTMSLLKTASLHRRDILRFRNDMAVREVQKGLNRAPYYYIMPASQHDPGEFAALVNLLMEHGVRLYVTGTETVLGDQVIEEGSIVVPLAQPYRAFIKEVMEDQVFPERHYTPGGEMIEPYDITSWSLPLHMGVKCHEIDQRYPELEAGISEIEGPFSLRKENMASGEFAIFPVQHNESFRAAFMGLASGLNVSRIQENIELGGGTVAKGSFVISSRSGKPEAWDNLLTSLTVDPVFTGQVPGKTREITLPRIALVETNFQDMDAGWTRFVFDTYHIPFKVVKPGDFTKIDFAGNFDVVVFPSSSKSILMSGKYGSEGNYNMSSLAPEYTKGIGAEGMKKLMAFTDAGGTIVSWGSSTALFQGTLSIQNESSRGKSRQSGEDTLKEEFQLPFRDISADLEKAGLSIPGSLVRIKLKKDHPVTLGMPDETGVFYRGQPVFQTTVPDFDMDRRVLGVTPEKNILTSGYMDGEKQLGNRSLLIWMKKGRGQFVLFAFYPQFRANTHATYKLLFNSLLLPPVQNQ